MCACVRVCMYVCMYVLIDLADLFRNHKFVGCVDQIRALVQHQVQQSHAPQI